MPKLTPLQWLGVVLVINGAMIGSSAQLNDIMGPHIAKIIISIASLGNALCGGLVTFLSGQGQQIKNVLAMPGIESVKVNEQANAALATIAVAYDQPKIEATPAAEATVVATAKAAS